MFSENELGEFHPSHFSAAHKILMAKMSDFKIQRSFIVNSQDAQVKRRIEIPFLSHLIKYHSFKKNKIKKESGNNTIRINKRDTESTVTEYKVYMSVYLQ